MGQIRSIYMTCPAMLRNGLRLIAWRRAPCRGCYLDGGEIPYQETVSL